MVLPVDHADLDRIVDGHHHDPHAILGPHLYQGAVTVRTFRPLATSVEVRDDDERYSLEHEHRGIWVGALPMATVPDYRLLVAYGGDAPRPMTPTGSCPRWATSTCT